MGEDFSCIEWVIQPCGHLCVKILFDRVDVYWLDESAPSCCLKSYPTTLCDVCERREKKNVSCNACG